MCDLKFYDIYLLDDILRLENLSQKAFVSDKTKFYQLVKMLKDDRTIWISTFEKNIDRV